MQDRSTVPQQSHSSDQSHLFAFSFFIFFNFNFPHEHGWGLPPALLEPADPATDTSATGGGTSATGGGTKDGVQTDPRVNANIHQSCQHLVGLSPNETTAALPHLVPLAHDGWQLSFKIALLRRHRSSSSSTSIRCRLDSIRIIVKPFARENTLARARRLGFPLLLCCFKAQSDLCHDMLFIVVLRPRYL